MTITVHEILQLPFLSRSREEQALIVSDGKPRPHIVVPGPPDIALSRAAYDKVPWATGCERTGCVYCWPCLLAGCRDAVWRVSDAELPACVVEQHQNCPRHSSAERMLRAFSAEQPAPKEQPAGSRYRQLTGKQPEVLRLLVDAVCELARSAPLLRITRDSNRVGAGSCARMLRLARGFCARDTRLVEGALALVEAHPRLVDDLAEAVKRALEARFKRDMESVAFVSLVLTEHSTDSNCSHLSLVARYVKGGRVHERLLGYLSVLVARTPRVVHDILLAMMQRFGIAGKLLSLSLGGGILSPEQVCALDGLFRPSQPGFCVVPCHFHGLHAVLRQSLYGHPEAGCFFKVLAALEEFFDRESSRHWTALEAQLLRETDDRCWRDWPLVTLVHRHRPVFERYLRGVAAQEGCSAAEALSARGFLRFLQRFQTTFLLRVVSESLRQPTIAFIEQAMRSPDPEPAFDRMSNLEYSLSVDSLEFEDVWQACSPGPEQRTGYGRLFEEVVERMHDEVKCRYSVLGGLEFLCLLQGEQYAGRERPKKPLDACLDLLQKSRFRVVEDAEVLANEVRVLKENQALLLGKDAPGVLEALGESGYGKVFPQLSRLFEFALTLPYRPPGGAKFARFPGLQVAGTIPPGEVSVLIVEAEYLSALRKDDAFFYRQVVAQLFEAK